jgi:hypothetical protein
MQSLRLIFVVFLLLGLATPGQAQGDTPRDLSAGDWLRVRTHTGERAPGTLVGFEDGRLRLQAQRDLVRDFPVVDLERLELSVGRDRELGVLVGGAVGLVGGFLVGALISSTADGPGGANLAVIGVPLFSTPAGALLGAIAAPHRYVRVAPPYRMSTTRDGRP